MSVENNHYQLLDISPSASMEEIKEAYLKLAFRYHPDRNQMSLSSNKIMEKILSVYPDGVHMVDMGYSFLSPTEVLIIPVKLSEIRYGRWG